MQMSDWSEYVEFAAQDALAIAPCPRCADAWYMDIEEDYGVPYTCYCCCNGSISFRNYEIVEEIN